MGIGRSGSITVNSSLGSGAGAMTTSGSLTASEISFLRNYALGVLTALVSYSGQPANMQINTQAKRDFVAELVVRATPYGDDWLPFDQQLNPQHSEAKSHAAYNLVRTKLPEWHAAKLPPTG